MPRPEHVSLGFCASPLVDAGWPQTKALDIVEKIFLEADQNGNRGRDAEAFVRGRVAELVAADGNGHSESTASPRTLSNSRRPVGRAEPTTQPEISPTRHNLHWWSEKITARLEEELTKGHGEVSLVEFARTLAEEVDGSVEAVLGKVRVVIFANQASYRVLSRATVVRSQTSRPRP